MRFGVREICDVVLKAKSIQKVGNKVFYKDEPVLYFDSLKTSSLEGAATTVYAQGGKGNSRLVAWEGERTITFTMEDALLSPTGFAILSGAGLINASDEKKIKTHVTERTVDVEFVAKDEQYDDYPTDNYVYFNNYLYTNDGWDVPHYPINGVPYAYDLNEDSEGDVELQFIDPICHICEDEDEEYNGKYMWFPIGTTDFSQQNAKMYIGPSLYSQSAQNNLIFIYIKQKPLINIKIDNDGLFYFELATPIYTIRLINDEAVTEPFYADNIQVVADENHPHYGEYRITLKTTDDLDKGFLKPSTTSFSYVKVEFEGKDTTQGWENQHNPDPDIEYYYKRNNEYVFPEQGILSGRIRRDDVYKYYWYNKADFDPGEVPLSPSNKVFYAKIADQILDDNIVVLLDYYIEKSAGYQIDITPDKFGGNYYLEASTLFRDQSGVDLPAEFIIPNCKIQSNFTFTMASTGDPSTFTFTMDAFPDYIRFDPTKKVLTSIQILDVTSEDSLRSRIISPWSTDEDASDATREKTWTGFEPAND